MITETEKKWARCKQEKRALEWGIKKTDGEYVTIPLVIAKLINKDLDALQKIKAVLKNLET